MVGSVAVGGGAPVTVQTMTNTPTADAKATIDQIRRCEEAGVDIIRVSCPDVESTAALKEIVRAANAGPSPTSISSARSPPTPAPLACINPEHWSEERASSPPLSERLLDAHRRQRQPELTREIRRACPGPWSKALDHIRIPRTMISADKVAVKASDVRRRRLPAAYPVDRPLTLALPKGRPYWRHGQVGDRHRLSASASAPSASLSAERRKRFGGWL